MCYCTIVPWSNWSSKPTNSLSKETETKRDRLQSWQQSNGTSRSNASMDLIDNPYNNNLNYDELGFFSTNTTKALTEICSLATETAQELCEYEMN